MYTLTERKYVLKFADLLPSADSNCYFLLYLFVFHRKKRSQPATLKNIAAKCPLLCRPRWLSVTERGEFSQQLICSPPCFCQEVQAGQVQTSECLRASISTTTTTREFEQANTNSSGNYFCHRFTSARRTERIVGWESCFRFCLKLDVRHNVPSFDLRCTYFRL